MYNVARNNFYENDKNSSVMTPDRLSAFIFRTIHKNIADGLIIDPCVGEGSLLKPFKENGFQTLGIDIEDYGFPDTRIENFLSIEKGEVPTPALVIANPPFNINRETTFHIARRYGRRPLLPEVWLQKSIELWGRDIPIVLFAPYGLRLNQSLGSKRWQRFILGIYPEIQSIIALPKDIYKEVLFHSEVLIFNIHGLKGHYFYNG